MSLEFPAHFLLVLFYKPKQTQPMAPAVHTEGSQTESEVRRLVLCFDGTGNKFTGDGSDTNIVKIYQKLNRNTEGQFHYYQRKSLLSFSPVWPTDTSGKRVLGHMSLERPTLPSAPGVPLSTM